MPHKIIALLCIAIAALGQLYLLFNLIGVSDQALPAYQWLMLHGALCAVASVAASVVLVQSLHGHKYANVASGSDHPKLVLFVFAICFLIPFVGTLGFAGAFMYGFREANLSNQEPDYWQVTKLAQLPFTTPIGRKATDVDSRGFTEHLMYSKDEQDLYKKVLAAANIENSLSVSALKQAMRHPDERIRLTAYKTLDKKVSDLNRDIQHLESRLAMGDGLESSNSWLHIASNYWELLTLEKDEPVAREQLLEKASGAAIQAVSMLPVNRNAHFILGRVSLLQGNGRRARVAFERASALGMPDDKVLPYLAEVEFKEHNFPRVRALLNQLDPSIRAYPPLSHVAEYWA
ncbi:MAG: hypothetical protein AB8B79_08450 [Granulosicoccus sp.]